MPTSGQCRLRLTLTYLMESNDEGYLGYTHLEVIYFHQTTWHRGKGDKQRPKYKESHDAIISPAAGSQPTTKIRDSCIG